MDIQQVWILWSLPAVTVGWPSGSILFVHQNWMLQLPIRIDNWQNVDIESSKDMFVWLIVLDKLMGQVDHSGRTDPFSSMDSTINPDFLFWWTIASTADFQDWKSSVFKRTTNFNDFNFVPVLLFQTIDVIVKSLQLLEPVKFKSRPGGAITYDSNICSLCMRKSKFHQEKNNTKHACLQWSTRTDRLSRQ